MSFRQTYQQLKEQGYTHLDIWSRGVDTTLYSPDKGTGSWRKQFGEDKFICLYVGRLSFEKGLDIYLDAIRKWNHAGGDKNTVFLFAGDGPYREYLENCGMDNVKLTGFVRGEMLAQLVLLRRKLSEGALKTAKLRSWSGVMDDLMNSYEEVLASLWAKQA